MKDEPFAENALDNDAYFARHLVLDPRGSLASDPILMNRDFYDVFVIVAGAAELPVLGSDGKTRITELRPGVIYHWRPQDHRQLALTTPDPIEFFQVGVRAGEWQAFTSFLGIPPVRQTAVTAPVATFDLVEDDVTPLFAAMMRAVHAGASTVALARFLLEIVPRLFSPTAMAEENAPAWLFSGVEAMRDEDNLRLGMPRFLELTRVSSRQLARLTRRYFGATPGAILADSRVRHAMRLLASTSESIASIADRCGYGTAAYFSYRFREETRMSPRDFRQRSLRGFHGARVPTSLSAAEIATGVRLPRTSDA